jgi:hypothetical protein
MSYVTWGQVSRWASEAGSKFPELTAAQFALESNWGSQVSGKNNLFGLKGSGSTVKTTEFINGKETVVYDDFIDFNTPQESVQYLVDRWYKDYKYDGMTFKGVNNAATREEAARMLVSEKYATDPQYSSKLIDIMNKNSAPAVTQPKPSNSIKLEDAARWYSAKPHQIEAWNNLQATLTPGQLATFAADYRAPRLPVQGSPAASPVLSVPYFYQRDSKTGHGERSCQSSAIAMVVEFLNPDLIKDDDEYLNLVFRFGDTISQTAQSKALNALGLKYQFKQNGTESELIRILDLGYPVPIGILHKGNIQNPTGGGHWITLIGYDEKYFYVHDPFGELDLINGGYPKTGPADGKSQKYTRENLLKRWLIHSKNDGWLWDLSENKR